MFVTYIQTASTATPTTQLTFDQLLRGETAEQTFHVTKLHTKTFNTDQLRPSARNNLYVKAEASMRRITPILRHYGVDRDMSIHYTSFRIPKRSGGTRQIDAPDTALKERLTKIREAFEEAGVLPHDCAYAYVKGRCTKDAIEVHQKAEHRWYLKVDLHNFFGSCTEEFIMQQLKKIAFFTFIPEPILEQIVHVAALNNGLPQGTPLSPWLTNQIMLPIDYEIAKFCGAHAVTYTRYADDMLFSANSKLFLLNGVVAKLREIIADTPLEINEEKTKISSTCGQNWNLGLMVNKDNNITVGTKKKERFRATLTDFCFNHENNESWNTQQTQELLGLMDYFRSIEPEYFENLLTKYNNKFNMDIRDTIIRKLK